MAMTKINFQNLPNSTTPINNTNLNAMQDNAEDYVDETKTALQTNINTVNTNLSSSININITKVLTALGLDTDTYSSSSTYAVGDMVVYNNTIYECTTAVSTAEDFDSSKWTIVPIIDN